MLLETLIAARDELGARFEAEALEQSFGNDAAVLEASTRALVRSARNATAESSERARDTGLIAELVGRESEFAMLMAAWESARLGRALTVRVAGAAGLGKTRLLNDFSARLRAMRARTVMVSARPADREVPFAHAADIAAALSALKGAAAVSPANAGALVALNPSLSSTFSVAPDARHGDDAFLHRALAIRELIDAIADESPIALLLDDHHWADPESRRLIAAVIAKIEYASVLIIIATRPGYSEVIINDARRIDLLPLSGANTTALLSSLGQLPSEPWTTSFCSLLHDVSGGSPLLVLETLHSLIERGLLELSEGKWSAPDAVALLATRHAPNAIDTRVRSSSDAERMVLAVMAIYGAPLPTHLLADVMGGMESGIAIVVADLEARGLVAGDGKRWWPSHDLLSESFADRLSGDERAKIERAIGDRLVAGVPDEPSLVRAARHYAAAGTTNAIADAFIPWLSLRRRRGDARSVRALMAAFAPELVAARGMWRQVPLHLRFPRWRAVSMTATAVVIGVVGIARALTPMESASDSVLAVWYDSAGSSYQWDVPVRRASLAKDDLIEVRSGSRHEAGLTPNRGRFVIAPDGRHWAGDMTYSDSGGMDLVITDETLGRVRRISSSRDDELNPAWSPDGRMLVFVTGRFNRNHWNDIAIYDIERDSVRPLTSGSDIDEWPVWSPLGDRIAFSRRLGDRPSYEICHVNVDGGMLECTGMPAATNAYPLGWYDDHRLVVYATLPDTTTGARNIIELMDLEDSSASREVYRSPFATSVTLSPDGKWVACGCQMTARGATRWFVFPLDNPELKGEIVRDRIETHSMMVGWLGRRRENAYLDRMEIDRLTAVQPLNVPLKLTASGIRADARRVDALPVQWSIVAGDAARLDGDVLVPRHPGTVRLRASAGGWRTVDGDVTIGRTAAEVAHTWRWDEPLEPGWILFGSPRSFVARDSMFGQALFPNGNGSFTSGVVSRRVFSTTDGLVVRAEFSTRIIARQWQSVAIGVLEEPDSVTVELAPTDSSGPGVGRRGCYAGLPTGEGMDVRRTIALVVDGIGSAIAPTSTSVETGAVQSMMLQLFPDGSCGLVLDGKIVGRVQVPGPPIRRARVTMQGQAVDTRIAIGPVTVSSGTDPRIDWRTKRR